MKPWAKLQVKRYWLLLCTYIYYDTCIAKLFFWPSGNTLHPFPSTNGETRLSDCVPRCESHGWVWREEFKWNEITVVCFSSNRFDGKNARSWLWQANKCSTNIVTPLLGGSMVQNVLRIIVFKQNISFSMQTPLTSQQHLSTTRPLKTMTLQLMFGKVSFKIFSTAFNSQFVFRKSLEHN